MSGQGMFDDPILAGSAVPRDPAHNDAAARFIRARIGRDADCGEILAMVLGGDGE